MIQAKTEESKNFVRKIVFDGNWGECYEDGIELDGFISFDQMERIVGYLKHKKDAEYWESWKKHNKDVETQN